MIRRDGVPVGFCLVLGARYIAAVEGQGDYLIWEMFVDADVRGTGVAEHGLRAILARHPGRWSVQAMVRNERATGFWRRVLLSPPYGGVEEAGKDGRVVFRFEA